MKTRIKFIPIWLFLLVAMVFTRCSKDEDTPNKNDDPAAVISGTYIGTLTVYKPGVPVFYDAEIIVTRNSTDEVTFAAKQGEEYSIVTSKTLKVYYNGSISVQSSSNDTQGIAIYTLDNKTLSLVTKQTAEADIHFGFEGVRK